MGALLPCFNERKGSVKFSHGCTLPVTDCELIFEDKMLLKWLITKLNLNCQRFDFTFILEEKVCFACESKMSRISKNQHYSQIVALLKIWRW